MPPLRGWKQWLRFTSSLKMGFPPCTSRGFSQSCGLSKLIHEMFWASPQPEESISKQKSQKLDEGVSRASDLAISAKHIESASPIALCRASA
jgi:hypothetical protein